MIKILRNLSISSNSSFLIGANGAFLGLPSRA